MTEPQFSSINTADSSPEPAAELWRSEVQARIAGYKKRSGRQVEGAFSMRFAFPADDFVEPIATLESISLSEEPATIVGEERESSTVGDVLVEADELPAITLAVLEQEIVAEEAPAAECVELAPAVVPEPEEEPFLDSTPRPRPKRKVIAFPRHLSVAPEMSYRLADPVSSASPRILDVPEELEAIPTTPFLDGLQLDPVGAANSSRDREHVELPFRAVRVSQRIFAGLVDIAVVGIGAGVFAGISFKILASPPLTKPLVVALILAAGLLWGVYQYLFVVHGGQTLGMMAAKIRLRTFKGATPNLRRRRHRVLGFYLSALSLGMGLMWAFVDVDALCWHDRFSQTYLADAA